MNEPRWKTALNWGAVITFLTLPMVLFVLQLYHWTHPGWLSVPKLEAEHIQYLREFLRNITFLVFGLAGLRTWEQVKANGNNNNKTKENRYASNKEDS